MTIKNIIRVIFISLPSFLFSQNTLTLQEAAKTTLANNYGVRIAQNNIRVAENNSSKEMNGYLPTLNLNAGPTGSFGGSTQKFNGGLGEVKVNNAFSWGANASLDANYDVFDKARDYNVEQLKEVLNFNNLLLRQTMETNLMQVYIAYYQVAQLTENLKVVSQTMNVSRQRLQRMEYRFEYGQGNGLEVLNAKVDIQRDSINILNLKQQISNAKRNLNVVMGMPVANNFEVDTTIVLTPSLSKQQLIADARSGYVGILLSNQDRKITEMDLQIIEASRKPTVEANASYNYSYSDNASGSFIESSFSRGLNFGLTANWNIFDGGRRSILEQNTRIALESQIVQKEQRKQELERDILNAWENYQNALFVLEVEKNALAINRQNLGRTQEFFNAGQVTSVEFRQAQLNLLNVATSFNNAKYSAKLGELQLLMLSGRILDGLN